MGNVNIDEMNEEVNLYLVGEKLRFLADVSSVKGMEFYHVLGNIPKNGRFVHLAKVSIPNVVENFTFGFASSLTGIMESFQDTDTVLRNVSDKEKDEIDIEAEFNADDTHFILKGISSGKQNNFQSKASWEGRLSIDCFNFDLNSREGRGVVISGKIMNSSKRSIAETIPTEITPNTGPMIVHFSEKICQDSSLTGGKGSSLGKLTELSKDFQNFIVPNGVVITTVAYNLCLQEKLMKLISQLKKVL
ncbi:phosphoenolpyruvate synthase [Caerostris extrusa]|uniref:Phosphoenolpyruvate synthase n=1 Tax=Caerostris extrusa TaxID=172846 RepID=A0AAV4SLT7_CAEEX|nr:phosphoenolpyruvate synthase [Caerostris extrusa]